MKQLTCEMCGSTDLIKQDGVFVCQSCGIKYSVEEARKLMIEGKVDVSGSTVFIDNTKQVENDLKRAKQYENEGNSRSAMEYYNKVLDADADNAEAAEGVSRIRNKNKYSEYYIVEPKISTEESVKRFLRGLSDAENIACDIYGNIKIKSIKEKFCDFSFLKASGYVSWTATRCDEYTENETVYKTEYRNGRQVQVPQTKKVTRVNRTPVNGSANWSCQQLFFASNAIVNATGGKSNSFAKELNEKLINLQDDNYGKYNPVGLDSSKLTEEEGITKYDGIEVEISTDYSKERNISSELINTEMNNCCEGALSTNLHTYYENINSSTHTSSKTIARILIPVQIITYEYKCKEYVAISDMVSNNKYMQTIPTDTELFNSQKDVSETSDKLTKRKHKDTPKILFGVAALMPIIGAVICFIDGGDFEPYPYVVLPLMGILVIIAIIFLLVDLSDKKAIQKEVADKSAVHKSLLEPKIEVLKSSRNRFFTIYSDISSIETAASSSKVNDSSVNNIEVLTTIAVSKTAKTNNSHSELSDKDLDEIKKLASQNKLEAIKKYIELYGVSLAEAKVAVEKFAENAETDNKYLSVDVSDDSDSEKEAALSKIKKMAAQNKIEAIKKYREVFNADLKEAKEAVDKMINQ